MKTNQEFTDSLKIALSFSGGGYRAALFHLGTLSYLSTIVTEQGTLLESVVAMSTISGGSITGLRYIVGIARGEKNEKIFHAIYKFLTQTDLPALALGKLSTYKTTKCCSLIRTMSEIYDKELFNGATFGELMETKEKIHLLHFSANATDFTNGLQFRFQLSPKLKDPPRGTPEYGIIGNSKIPLNRKNARYIHLSDILATSSCFPSGFEPLMFPEDFILPESVMQFFRENHDPFGLMDGGIVDNQGIQPLLLAEQRMKRDNPEQEGNCLDLILVSDVASPYMESYKPISSIIPKSIGKQSIRKFFITIYWIEGVFTLLFAISVLYTGFTFLSGFLLALWILTSGITILSISLRNKLLNLLKKSIVKNSVNKILDLRIQDITPLVANRIKSVLKLTGEVFMKHLRRMDYYTVYEDESWKSRRVMNAVYELRSGEAWEGRHLPEYLKPSIDIQTNTAKAASMGTTLWFSEKEKEEKMPETLIADGQYTTCWNLLELIRRLKNDPDQLTPQQKIILSCEEQLRKDWENFQKDPLCMVHLVHIKD